MSGEGGLRVEERAGGWRLAGPAASGFGLVNEYLGYLVDRRYSPRTVRAYAFDLLAWCRWLLAEDVGLDQVDTPVLLRYLAFCRTATYRGRPGGNVYSIGDGRNVGYAAATVNRRLAAVSGLFEFVADHLPCLAAGGATAPGRHHRRRASQCGRSRPRRLGHQH